MVKRRRDEVLTGLPGLGGRGLADSLDGRSLTRTRKRLLVSMRSAASSIYSVGRDCLVGGLGVWLCLRKLRRFFAGLSGVLYAILSPAVIAGIAGLGSIMLPINIGIPREPSSLTSPERL
jgi:hypothetical protein